MNTLKYSHREYQRMADFLEDYEFDFSESTIRQYEAMAKRAVAAGYVVTGAA